jgi:hypothetical protein
MALVKWWATRYGSGGTERDHGVALFHRLAKSMPEPSCELLLFATFAQVYGRADGFDLPALMPQADTQRYAEMVREDRSLRLAGCTSTASGGRN